MISERTERSMPTDQVSQLLEWQSDRKWFVYSFAIVTVRSLKDALKLIFLKQGTEA